MHRVFLLTVNKISQNLYINFHQIEEAVCLRAGNTVDTQRTQKGRSSFTAVATTAEGEIPAWHARICETSFASCYTCRLIYSSTVR